MSIKQESRAYFKALGAHVSELRKERAMTQAELARALGVSQQTVFAYELGDRRLSVLILAKLSKVFGVPVDELIGMTKSSRPVHPKLSPAGVRHAERFQQLPVSERRFIRKMVDTCFEKLPSKRSTLAN